MNKVFVITNTSDEDAAAEFAALIKEQGGSVEHEPKEEE